MNNPFGCVSRNQGEGRREGGEGRPHRRDLGHEDGDGGAGAHGRSHQVRQHHQRNQARGRRSHLHHRID